MGAGRSLQVQTFDGEAAAADEEPAAAGAVGVFPGIPGEVPAVDVLQAGGSADLRGPVDGFGRSGRCLRHPVLGVKAADVPGGLRPEGDDEGREFAEFLPAVVQAGDEERRHLDPDPERLHEPEAVKDRLEARAALLLVKVVAKGLQIDVRCVEPRGDELQHPGGHVAVRHEDVFQTLFPCDPGGFKGEFEKDGRLRVGVGDALRAAPDGLLHNLRRGPLPPDDSTFFPGHLRDLVVLAEGAAEVAARRGDGEGARTGQEMEEGFLLDGIDVLGEDSPIDEAVEDPFPVFPDAAEAALAGIDPAAVGAEAASDPILRFLFIQQRFMNHFSCPRQWSVKGDSF